MTVTRDPARAVRSAPHRVAGAIAAAVACAVFGCTDTGPSGPDGLEAEPALTVAGTPGARAMKIRGTVELVEPLAPSAPCFLHFRSALAGNATHLGRYEGEGSTCILVDLSTAVPDPSPPFLPSGPPPYITAPFSNPLWVLRAANGDELWLAATEAVAVLSAVDGSIRAEGTHVVVGGTGRFAGATGELASTAWNDDDQGPDELRSEGWIRF